MRLATLVVSAAFFILAVAYWFGADAITVSTLAGHVGADGLPKLLSWVLGGLAILLAAQTLLEQRRAAAVAAAEGRAKDEPRLPGTFRGHMRALGLIGFGIIYLLILPHLGYLLSSALLLAAVAVYAGLKSMRSTVLLAVIGGICFYLIFVKVLQIPLPPGFWPSLLG